MVNVTNCTNVYVRFGTDECLFSHSFSCLFIILMNVRVFVSASNFMKALSCNRDLNSGPLPYQGSALPLSYYSNMSGKRGSNPRPPAWKASALSTELFPQKSLLKWVVMDSNHRSRKTADLQSAPFGHSGNHPLLCALLHSCVAVFPCLKESLLSDSNQRPRDYKSRALAN